MATLVVPDQIPLPVEDAQDIRKAVEGWGTDDKELISILAHRNAAQREAIRVAYEQLYQEDLIKRLESELSGEFERAICHWILDPLERDSVLAKAALKKGGLPNYRAIIEIACVPSPGELLAIKRAYQFRYKRCLEEDIASHTTGDFRKFLLGLVSTYRYEGYEIDSKLAKSEADILHDVIEKKVFNHDEIIRILTTRSKAQLIATFNYYKDEHKISITKSLLEDPADEFLAALRATIRCIVDPTKYFEKVLRTAIQNPGTDEESLSRVIVRRAEKDLKEIKDKYYQRNNVTLDDAVAKEISGDYKTFLLHLLASV